MPVETGTIHISRAIQVCQLVKEAFMKPLLCAYAVYSGAVCLDQEIDILSCSFTWKPIAAKNNPCMLLKIYRSYFDFGITVHVFCCTTCTSHWRSRKLAILQGPWLLASILPPHVGERRVIPWILAFSFAKWWWLYLTQSSWDEAMR